MNTRIEYPHPSVFLDSEITAVIRGRAQAAETLGRLHADQLESIYRNKWFKMFVPQNSGGLGLTLPEILKIEECLSWADGSTAWVVTLCSGAGWFIGFLNPGVAHELFGHDLLCVAGSGALTGTAEEVDGGYEINGVWKYASGAWHASAFTVNCYITKNNQQVYHPDGSPKVASFILKRGEVTLHTTWKAMGMVATGSHAFEISQLRIPASRCFTIAPDHTVLKDPIYRYPFLQLAETTLAVNISGMAVRFIDLAESLLEKKVLKDASKYADAAQLVLQARMTINGLRQSFFDQAEESWTDLVSQNEIPAHVLAAVSRASQVLVAQSRAAVNLLYPHCGLAAADTGSEINRVWRNLHTAGQHALFNATAKEE